jgi:hypothetical protein
VTTAGEWEIPRRCDAGCDRGEGCFFGRPWCEGAPTRFSTERIEHKSAANRRIVPLVRNSIVHLAPVTLGYDNGYAVETTSGISKDDLIALNLGQSATEGEHVQPVQQAE